MSSASEPTHTLADLAHWSLHGTSLAVLGSPVAHSLSPEMHNAALAGLARTRPEFADWRYFKFDVDPADLPRALDLFRRKQFRGLNLTVPHKALALGHLVAGDAFVRVAGAANTLIKTDTGWSGANTDGVGLACALHSEFAAPLRGAHVILLGAGGAARAAAVQCLQDQCASLWIGNRSPASLRELKGQLAPLDRTSILVTFDLNHPPADLPPGSLVINATSLGLKHDDGSPLDLTRIPRPAAVFDMIYRPARTALLRQAAELGIAHANGLSMLVHQGARSLELWAGVAPSVPLMLAAARSALGAS